MHIHPVGGTWEGLLTNHYPTFICTSPPSEGLGEAAPFWCLLLSFVNLFPFYFLIYALLDSKRACFTTQKGTFYKPLYNHLFINRLQSAKNLASLYYRLYYNLLFVRYFLNTKNTIFFLPQSLHLYVSHNPYTNQHTP